LGCDGAAKADPQATNKKNNSHFYKAPRSWCFASLQATP
jgi:hypothetical protein